MKTLLSITAVAAAACLSFVAPAQAVTNFTLNSVEGAPLQVDVQISNFSALNFGGNPLVNGVEIKLDVAGGYYADLRSAYFHISDESLLNGLIAVGPGILTPPFGQINEDSVTNLGFSNDIIGAVANTYGGFDVGVNIGTPTIIADDFQSATFYVVSLSGAITEEMFQTLPFAVHAGSVGTSGPQWYYRFGSSDLAGIVPGDGVNQNQGGPDNGTDATAATPEPATAAMGLLSLAGLAAASRRRRNK